MSFVTSPAHTRSHSAREHRRSSAVPGGRDAGRARTTRRARPRCSRIASCDRPSGGSSGRRAAQGSRSLVAEEQRDAAVVGAERARADPHELARRAELVEVGGPVPATRAGSTSVSRTEAGIAAPWSCSIASTSASVPPRRAVERPATPAGTARASRRRPARPRAQRRERAPAERRRTSTSHHSRSTPPGRNSPCTTRPSRLERLERRADAVGGDAEPRGDVARRRTAPCVRAYRATRSSSGARDRLGERGREALRERDAERVAQPRRVLDGGDALLAGDPHADRAPLGDAAARSSGAGRRAGRARDLVRRAGRRGRAGGRAGRRRRAPGVRRRGAAARARARSSALGSSSSRSSSAPSSSRSRSRSSASAAARRSASGASPSYM